MRQDLLFITDCILLDMNLDKEDVAAGIMQHWEYRVKWYGEDEEKAKEMVGMPAEVIE